MTGLADVQLHLVDDFDTAQEFMRWLGERRPVLGIDTETGGLEWWREPLRLVTFGDTRHGWALPWHDWAGLVKEAVGRYDDRIVMHNMKFDTHFLEKEGVNVPRRHVDDTMLKAHAVDPTESVALKSLTARLVDPKAAGNQQILQDAMRKQGWDWGTVPTDFDVYWMYGALDPVLTVLLDEKLDPLVPRDIYELERASTFVLCDMERRGVRIDVPYVQKMLMEAQRWISETIDWFKDAHGIENANSNKQLTEALLAAGAQLVARTPSGQYKMDEKVLKSLDHPIANAVLQLRKVEKIAGTYLRGFLELVDEDWLLHPSIHPVGARTGRMSVTAPPLQTLPRGATVRDAFIPRDENALLLSDFDQVEMRVFAHFAQEQGMIEAIRSGVDLHTYVCRELYGIPADQDPPREKRQITKNANFSKVYVAGVATFAATAGIPESDARTFLQRYDTRFPGVRQFHAQVMQLAKERFASEGEAYITTPYGRRHTAPPDKTYKLVNYLIQGTCADLLKQKLIELDAAGVGDYMVLPVHDEIVFDVPREDAAEVARTVEEVMTETERFAVPLTVGVDQVERWGDKYRDE